MMFGKHFKSMYEGSMVGAGVCVFATWGYAIAHMQPDTEHGYVVVLNSRLLSAIFGCEREPIDDAISFLCAPDPESTTKAEAGRRIIQVSQFEYRVVNGQKYQGIRNAEDRKRQNREAQARYREKEKAKNAKLGTKGLPYVNPDSLDQTAPKEATPEVHPDEWIKG